MHTPILELKFFPRQAPSNLSSRTSVQHAHMGYVGQRVKELREARGLSQTQVAVFCDVSQKAISLLENDPNRVPQAQTLKMLAQLFEVDRDWLLTGKGPRNPVSSLTDEESELLLLYRAVSDAARAYILDRVRVIHRGEYGNGAPPPKQVSDTPRLPAPLTKPN